jgi:hypothetical protein
MSVLYNGGKLTVVVSTGRRFAAAAAFCQYFSSPSPKWCFQSPKFSDSDFREVRGLGLGRPKSSVIWSFRSLRSFWLLRSLRSLRSFRSFVFFRSFMFFRSLRFLRSFRSFRSLRSFSSFSSFRSFRSFRSLRSLRSFRSFRSFRSSAKFE